MQRPSSKNTRQANADEKRFQGWCKEQPCCITGEYGVQVHHCVGSAGKNNKVLIGHYFCLPLTKEKHDEYHSGTKAFREKYGNQCDLWEPLAARYQLESQKVIPYDVFESIKMMRR